MRAAFGMLLALLLVGPIASAAAPMQVEARLDSYATLIVEGPLRASSTSASIDLFPAVRAGEALNISWGTGSGNLVSTHQDFSNLDFRGGSENRNDSLTWGGGRITAIECAVACRVYMVAQPGPTLATYESTSRQSLKPLATDAKYWSMLSEPSKDNFFHAVPAGGLGLTATDANITATGRFGLFVQNATINILWANGTRSTISTVEESTVDTGGSIPEVGRAVVDRTVRFAYVILDDMTLDLLRTQAVFFTPTAEVEAEGNITLTRATGQIQIDARTVQLDRDAVDLVGRTTMTLSNAPIVPTLLSAKAAVIRAEAEHVSINGAAYTPAGPTITPTLAATATVGILALLGLLAFALLRGTVLLAPFYSRIAPTAVMQNHNRRAISQAIRESPGQNVADISRRLDMARAIVVHHAAILSSHGYVNERRIGRERRLYPAEATPSSDTAAADALLSDPMRARVLEVLRSSRDGLTQAEVAELAECSRRLASYHLAKLEGCAMVVSEGKRNKTYRAAPAAASSAA